MLAEETVQRGEFEFVMSQRPSNSSPPPRSSPLSSSASATSTYSKTSTSSPRSVDELPSLHITVAREEGVDAEEILVVSKVGILNRALIEPY